MPTTTLFLAAYLAGCLAAIPAGPIQIEVLKRSLQGHLSTAFVVISVTAAVDMAYGAVALLGLAPALKDPSTMAMFWMAGGMLLVFIGLLTIWRDHSTCKPRKKAAAITALALSLTNPVMLLWWLATARLLHDSGLLKNLDNAAAATIIIGGATGMSTYLATIATIIHRTKRFISPRTIQRIHVVFGCILLALGVYFIASSIRQI